MNQIKNFTRKFIKGTFKFLFYTTIILLLLLGSAIIALQFPYVQTKVVNKATEYLSETLKFPISIQSVDIDWFDEIVLKGVTVHDPRKGKMVYLSEAVVDFEITSLHKAKFNIDEITLRNGKVNVHRYASDGMINITEFINAIRDLATPKEKTGKPPVPFTIDAVKLDNMRFSYFDERKVQEQNCFDHNHFEFDSIYANVTNFRVVADTFQINVSKLKSREVNTNLRVHEVNTLFTITKSNMTFDKLYAHIDNSIVKDYIKFNYSNINDLSDFNNKINVTAHLDKSKINFKNLSEFAPQLKGFHENAYISGNFKGYVTNFSVKDLDLSFGRSSRIQGKISFNGLPDFEETFIDFKFSNAHIQANDLKQYLDNQSYTVLKKFGTITGKGDFVGFPENFVTTGTFNTDLGKLVSNMQLNAKSETGHPTYEGHLITHSFNLGKLVDLPDKVQLIDMDGNIKGSGFSLEDAEVDIDAKISRLGLNNYNYRNIVTDAKLSNREFNGFINVRDTNLTFVANGKIDLTKDKEIFDIKAQFKKANLKPLNFSHVATNLKTDLVLNFTGTNIDEIIGEATFKNTYLLYENDKEIMIDSLYISSQKKDSIRTLEIKSDLLSLHANGNFAFTTLSKDVEKLYKEYKLNIDNEKSSLNAYYSGKHNHHSDHKYSLDFDVNVKNLNSLFEIYFPGLYLSKGLTIEGDFASGHNSILNVNTHIDTFFYKDNEMFNTNIELSTSKLADSSNVLAMFYINSAKQRMQGFPETKNFFFEGIWDKRSIDFSTNISQVNSSNYVNLRGNLSFLENKELLTLYNSNINLINKIWAISPNNKIYFAKNEVNFENLVIANANQSISINGSVSDNADNVAEMKVVNFDLKNINGLLPGYNMAGIVNGKILIKDLFKDLDLNSNLTVNTFAVDGFLIGNINGKSNWDNHQKQLNIDLEVERAQKVTIILDGFIKPQIDEKKEELFLIAHLQDAELETLSPLLKGVMSDIGGKVSGDFKITGTIKDPSLKGKADIDNGKFKIDYLGTTYYFDDYIYLDENSIGFKKLKLNDEFGNTGIIDGGISHDGFKKFIVDIKGKLNQLNVLSTTENDNNLFYGTAFVSGNFEILGPFSNLEINANATSKKGTKIYIPLNSYEGLEQQTFITFKSRKEKKKKDDKNDVDLSGIKLDFNFELNPDAYAEIIFDKRAGDIIRGYGNGNIKMTIDTRGDFNMYGNYKIARGAYNYTLAGLVSKEFKIDPSSTINWTGDPYAGILDVRAYFENKVPITPLITDSITRKSELGRTHPVKVILDIDGELMSPTIALDIDITPTTAVATEVATRFESDIKRNENELNKQVFSLVVIGNFSPQNSFSGSGAPSTTVSQLLTNQLGNWLSQVDENLVIDIDLNGLDRDALNTFNLRLSYTMLDGRLRISRDGSFSNFQNTTQQSLSNIAGEWTVEYLLNKDGKFRLKLYNRNNQNALLNSLNAGNNNTSAGFSVLHTQTFTSLGELLGIKKKQKSDKPEDDKKNELINLALPPKPEDELTNE